MHKRILMVSLLVAAVLVSGCTQQDGTPDDRPPGTNGESFEASAYDQIEQELEQAIEDIDLDGLENELLI